MAGEAWDGGLGGPQWGVAQAGWALPLLQLRQLLCEGRLAIHQPPGAPPPSEPRPGGLLC